MTIILNINVSDKKLRAFESCSSSSGAAPEGMVISETVFRISHDQVWYPEIRVSQVR